jgi:Homeodomain-like domain
MAQRVEVVLSDEEREMLERWARRPKSSQALAFRCRVVLAAAEGRSSTEIAAELGCTGSTVGRWPGRFARRESTGCMTSRVRASRARRTPGRLNNTPPQRTGCPRPAGWGFVLAHARAFPNTRTQAPPSPPRPPRLFQAISGACVRAGGVGTSQRDKCGRGAETAPLGRSSPAWRLR